MSQKTSRKSQNPTIIVISDDKEKVDTPVKEMKKKIAANAEKDKQTAEKTDKPAEKTDKNETVDKNKSTEKTDKNADKNKSAEKTDKNADKTEKNVDKSDKNADKVPEKKTDKSEKATEKKPEKSVDKKADKSVEKKSEQAEKDESKGDKAKEKGRGAVNGCNGAAANGDDGRGTVSDSDGELVIEEDEAFPELAYDDSDSDAEDAPSRSLTRRSQVKATKTPETPAPRPASERESEDSKESKVLKLTEVVAPSDRKLRSADSPKPDAKQDKKLDTVQEEEKKTKKDSEATKKDQAEAEKGPKDGKTDKMEVEIADAESSEGTAGRSRARVSPYSRARLDRSAASAAADYTGNNSTMEMDITESSFLEEPLDASGYLRGLRGIRGRSSYKLLHELKLTNPNAGRPRPPPTAASRPTGAVVGRKRKPSPERAPLSAVELGEEATDDLFAAHGKRMRLLDRLAQPFRRAGARRAAEITGINTDLPLSAPVASTSFASFDPESIKAAPAPARAPAPGEPVATPLPPHAPLDRDGKRCVVM